MKRATINRGVCTVYNENDDLTEVFPCVISGARIFIAVPEDKRDDYDGAAILMAMYGYNFEAGIGVAFGVPVAQVIRRASPRWLYRARARGLGWAGRRVGSACARSARWNSRCPRKHNVSASASRSMAGAIVSAPLAGAAYPKGFKGDPLYHAVELDADERPARVLCREVRIAHVLDDRTQYNSHGITCKACLRLMSAATRKVVRVEKVVGTHGKSWQIVNEHGGLIQYVDGTKRKALAEARKHGKVLS